MHVDERKREKHSLRQLSLCWLVLHPTLQSGPTWKRANEADMYGYRVCMCVFIYAFVCCLDYIDRWTVDLFPFSFFFVVKRPRLPLSDGQQMHKFPPTKLIPLRPSFLRSLHIS